MDALQALYDSQVSEDDAVAVLQCSQQCDKSVELDESVFGVVSIATIDVQADQEAPRQIEEIVPADGREAPRQIEEIVPAAEIAPDEEGDMRRSRSRSTGRSEMLNVDVYVPQLDVDNLPTRIHDPHRHCRLVPEGRPPKAIRGLCLDELTTLIRRCGFQGAWRQGGKQSRAVFVGDGFIISQEKSSTWAQGVSAEEIDARIRAARSSGH